MAVLIPGQKLTIPKDKAGPIANILMEQVRDLDNTYSDYFNAIATWWRWFEATPRTAVKNFPFKNASNVVIPLIKIMSDALVARAMARTFSHGKRIWTTSTENEDASRLAKNVARRVNWGAQGHDHDFVATCYDWYSELYPIGSSVLAYNYRHVSVPMFFGPGSDLRSTIKNRFVEIQRGVSFEHSPREFYLWDTRFPIEDAPIVIRKHLYSWSKLNEMSMVDKLWNREAVKEIKGQGDGGLRLGPTLAVTDVKNTIDKRSPGASEREMHTVYEIHVDWPMLRGSEFQLPGAGTDQDDPNAPELPIVIHLHANTESLLRSTAEPYHVPGKPFLDGHFRKRSGRSYSAGVAKELEQLQSMATTQFNQAADSQTRANAIWSKTTDPRLRSKPLDPSESIYLNNMDDFEVLNVGASPLPEATLITMANTWAEKLIGVTDPLQGRETRSGGHPSPATSTLALLQQTDVMSTATDMMLRRKVSKAGQISAILIQQFETNDDGQLTKIFGETDTQDLEEFLFPTDPIPGLINFDLVAMSDTANPQVELQRAMTVGQINERYWAFVLRGVQALESPQAGPMLKAGWKQAIKSVSALYERILNSQDIDDMEKFIAALDGIASGPAGDIRDFAQNAGQVLGGAGAGPVQGSNGSPALGPPSGANGSNGPLGVLQ